MLTVSLVVATGIGVLILVRTGYQRIWPGVITALFGFALASTGAAPAINSALGNLTDWISHF